MDTEGGPALGGLMFGIVLGLVLSVIADHAVSKRDFSTCEAKCGDLKVAACDGDSKYIVCFDKAAEGGVVVVKKEK